MIRRGRDLRIPRRRNQLDASVVFACGTDVTPRPNGTDLLERMYAVSDAGTLLLDRTWMRYFLVAGPLDSLNSLIGSFPNFFDLQSVRLIQFDL
jgi:hypothetical protein